MQDEALCLLLFSFTVLNAKRVEMRGRFDGDLAV